MKLIGLQIESQINLGSRNVTLLNILVAIYVPLAFVTVSMLFPSTPESIFKMSAVFSGNEYSG